MLQIQLSYQGKRYAIQGGGGIWKKMFFWEQSEKKIVTNCKFVTKATFISRSM